MRIIAGKYRNRKLMTLDGLATRPTIERTKQAIFNSLGQFFHNGEITLDIFGGSGALSLESLSRGAKKAYIIDSSPDAIAIIKKNAEMLRVTGDLEIIKGDYKEILPNMVGKMKFDVIFLDPPFRMKVIDELITYIINNKLIQIGGMIVAEYPKIDIIRKNYEELTLKKCSTYASSEVVIFVANI
jgi:16S rRNA (guanine(966)-N(2))-methyltransferase RsmD